MSTTLPIRWYYRSCDDLVEVDTRAEAEVNATDIIGECRELAETDGEWTEEVERVEYGFIVPVRRATASTGEPDVHGEPTTDYALGDEQNVDLLKVYEERAALRAEVAQRQPASGEVAQLRRESALLKANAGMQPIVRDALGVVRFKANAIVRWLVDSGRVSLNELAMMSFSRSAREQFWQMLGYSVSGFGDLGFPSRETIARADAMAAMLVDPEAGKVAAPDDEEPHPGFEDALTRLLHAHSATHSDLTDEQAEAANDSFMDQRVAFVRTYGYTEAAPVMAEPPVATNEPCDRFEQAPRTTEAYCGRCYYSDFMHPGYVGTPKMTVVVDEQVPPGTIYLADPNAPEGGVKITGIGSPDTVPAPDVATAPKGDGVSTCLDCGDRSIYSNSGRCLNCAIPF